MEEQKKLPKPTPADYEKRRKMEQQIDEGNSNDDLESDYLDMLNSFDWETKTFEKDGKYGLINPLGEILVQPFFEDFMMGSRDELKNGDRVVAMLNGKWGVLVCDRKGSWLIEPEYDFIGYPNTITQVNKNGKWGIIDLSKKAFIIPLECDEVSNDQGFMFVNGIGTFDINGKTGVIRDDGTFTEAIFEEVDGFPDELVKVKLNGKWGYINEQNQFTEDEDEAYFQFLMD